MVDYTYEHFPVVCPSCEGDGTIEEGISNTFFYNYSVDFQNLNQNNIKIPMTF